MPQSGNESSPFLAGASTTSPFEEDSFAPDRFQSASKESCGIANLYDHGFRLSSSVSQTSASDSEFRKLPAGEPTNSFSFTVAGGQQSTNPFGIHDDVMQRNKSTEKASSPEELVGVRRGTTVSSRKVDGKGEKNSSSCSSSGSGKDIRNDNEDTTSSSDKQCEPRPFRIPTGKEPASSAPEQEPDVVSSSGGSMDRVIKKRLAKEKEARERIMTNQNGKVVLDWERPARRASRRQALPGSRADLLRSSVVVPRNSGNNVVNAAAPPGRAGAGAVEIGRKNGAATSAGSSSSSNSSTSAVVSMDQERKDQVPQQLEKQNVKKVDVHQSHQTKTLKTTLPQRTSTPSDKIVQRPEIHLHDHVFMASWYPEESVSGTPGEEAYLPVGAAQRLALASLQAAQQREGERLLLDKDEEKIFGKKVAKAHDEERARLAEDQIARENRESALLLAERARVADEEEARAQERKQLKELRLERARQEAERANEQKRAEAERQWAESCAAARAASECLAEEKKLVELEKVAWERTEFLEKVAQQTEEREREILNAKKRQAATEKDELETAARQRQQHANAEQHRLLGEQKIREEGVQARVRQNQLEKDEARNWESAREEARAAAARAHSAAAAEVAAEAEMDLRARAEAERLEQERKAAENLLGNQKNAERVVRTREAEEEQRRRDEEVATRMAYALERAESERLAQQTLAAEETRKAMAEADAAIEQRQVKQRVEQETERERQARVRRAEVLALRAGDERVWVARIANQDALRLEKQLAEQTAQRLFDTPTSSDSD